MADTFYVSTSVMETTRLLNNYLEENSISGQLIDQYALHHKGDIHVEVLVFEKHYIRAGNRLTLTVVIDNLDGRTRVHMIGGGGGEGLFRFDWGAEESFEESVIDALSNCIIEKVIS
jgi:hypothetical protein